jgi:predicted metallo-beta-lactamase superfamily hydrolase
VIEQKDDVGETSDGASFRYGGFVIEIARRVFHTRFSVVCRVGVVSRKATRSRFG